jgi:transcriptional regulator with XRE-family HTH domain
MSTHYGAIIEKVIRRNGHSISDLAKATNVNRRSVYNWFNQRRLKPDVINRIGAAINYDFSRDMPELLGENNLNAVSGAEGAEQNNIWKDKYVELMERYNEMLYKTQMMDLLTKIEEN